jgi:hypothetical protein
MKVRIHDTYSGATTEHVVRITTKDWSTPTAMDMVQAADRVLGVAGDMPYDELVISSDTREECRRFVHGRERLVMTRKIVVKWRDGRGSTGTYTFW